MQPIRETDGGVALHAVTRTFGDLHAVDDVTLHAPAGKVVGLLGHNGAGKTTLMRLIAGLLRPDTGTISVLGMDPIADGRAVRSNLGVLPSTPLVDGRLTANENLTFAAAMRGLDPAEGSRRALSLLKEFDLDERADDRVSEFSAGMKQRLALATVLVAKPRVLLLDEPTSAMDPVGAREFLDRLRHLRSVEERTIILATHDLGVASALCDEVSILSQGKVILQGAPDALTEQLGVKTRIKVGSPDQALRAVDIIRDLDPTATAIEDRVLEAGRLRGALAPTAIRRLVEAGIDIYSVRDETATLEDLYFQLHDESTQTPSPDASTTHALKEEVCS